jgi:fluoroquinolone transport system permease protein
MGAILLFEKTERVHPSLAVSPIRTDEYCSAKLISLSIVSLLAGMAIHLAGGGSISLWMIVSLVLSSFLFSLLGLFIGTKAQTLNSYLILTVPAEILLFVPSLLWYFGVGGDWLLVHPGVAALNLLRETPKLPLLSLLSLSVWILIATLPTREAVRRMLLSGEGEVVAKPASEGEK